MGSARDGLKQIAELAHPRTLKQLRSAGALDPRGSIAMVRNLPWLFGRGPSLGIATQMNAMVLGDKPALIDRNGTVSWRELDKRSNRAAHLLSSCGVRPGDRFGMLLRNGREMAELMVGSQKYGIVSCPLNTWAKPKELKATLRGVQPTVLFYDTAHSDQVEACSPGDLPLIAVGDLAEAVPGSLSYDELLEAQSDSTPAPFTRDRGSPRVVIQTSGTTGAPKGAARNAAGAGMGALADLISVVPYRRDDVVYCPAPLFHSFGLATLTFAVGLGATVVLPEKFEAEASLALIEQHRATAASLVPVMMRRMLSLDARTKKRYDLSSLRIVLASGSVLSEDIRRGAIDLFGDVLYDLYGSTEVGWVAIARPEDMKTRKGTVGRPVRGIDVAVFSPDGKRLGPTDRGELFVKSHITFEGYTSGESRDEREGYMSIGDVGYLDDDGYLFVAGRADDMVVVGGENIYPVEVEQVIEDIHGVDEVAVLGVPDEEYGHILVAFVSGSVVEDTVVDSCRQELASYKVPRKVEIRDELPRTSTGKILKRELAETVQPERSFPPVTATTIGGGGAKKAIERA